MPRRTARMRLPFPEEGDPANLAGQHSALSDRLNTGFVWTGPATGYPNDDNATTPAGSMLDDSGTRTGRRAKVGDWAVDITGGGPHASQSQDLNESSNNNRTRTRGGFHVIAGSYQGVVGNDGTIKIPLDVPSPDTAYSLQTALVCNANSENLLVEVQICGYGSGGWQVGEGGTHTPSDETQLTCSVQFGNGGAADGSTCRINYIAFLRAEANSVAYPST